MYYRTVKRLLIPILQMRVRNGKLVLLFFNQNICCGYLNGPIKRDGSFEVQITLFNLLIRETSQFLCYERLLNMTYEAYKSAFSRKMQFWSNCYTVVSYQAPFRLSVYKIPAVYLSGAKNVCFCTIRDFGSPTIVYYKKLLKIVNEYDQEIPQSQTANNPMAPRGRATQPLLDTRKINKTKQPVLSSPSISLQY